MWSRPLRLIALAAACPPSKVCSYTSQELGLRDFLRGELIAVGFHRAVSVVTDPGQGQETVKGTWPG